MKRLNCRLMDTLNEYFAIIINFIVAIINVYSGIIGDEQCVLSMKCIRMLEMLPWLTQELYTVKLVCTRNICRSYSFCIRCKKTFATHGIERSSLLTMQELCNRMDDTHLLLLVAYTN